METRRNDLLRQAALSFGGLELTGLERIHRRVSKEQDLFVAPPLLSLSFWSPQPPFKVERCWDQTHSLNWSSSAYPWHETQLPSVMKPSEAFIAMQQGQKVRLLNVDSTVIHTLQCTVCVQDGTDLHDNTTSVITNIRPLRWRYAASLTGVLLFCPLIPIQQLRCQMSGRVFKSPSLWLPSSSCNQRWAQCKF